MLEHSFLSQPLGFDIGAATRMPVMFQRARVRAPDNLL